MARPGSDRNGNGRIIEPTIIEHCQILSKQIGVSSVMIERVVRYPFGLLSDLMDMDVYNGQYSLLMHGFGKFSTRSDRICQYLKKEDDKRMRGKVMGTEFEFAHEKAARLVRQGVIKNVKEYKQSDDPKRKLLQKIFMKTEKGRKYNDKQNQGNASRKYRKWLDAKREDIGYKD